MKESGKHQVNFSETAWGWNLVKAVFVGVLLLIALNGKAQQAPPPSTGAQDLEPFRISLNVDLVILETTVRDRNGRVALGLLEKHFEVYEDGVRQSIRLFRHEDVPVRVGLVVDHSGSMRNKIAEVVAGARSFVQFSNPEDEIFVVNFNEKVTLGVSADMRFNNRGDELEFAISNSPTTGMTALYDAIANALERLQVGNKVKKVLIVISDGGDNASRQTLPGILKMSGQSGALVYTIGVFDEEDPDRNPGVLKRLASTTGGEAFFPSELSEVVTICAEIAREIRSQYTIGYFSANPGPAGSQRTVRVQAKEPEGRKLIVRTRSGYVVGPQSTPPGQATIK